MTLNRRNALALIGSSAALGLPGAGQAADGATIRFDHGVASGDPAADGAVIWTRVTLATGAGDVPITWHVATSADGAPVASGQATARFAADHTVKVEVARLKPGRDYWYWFTGSAGERSPTGRFRTLPVGAVDDLVLAVASCQLYPGGLFNAYADLATLPRLDAVLHLGDYIYEYGAEGYGGEIGRKLGRLPDPPHEILSLADYRRRHAQVKADPDMQAAHARAAFICVWDDHEVANDGWIGGAENHDPATEGDWKARKAAAMQAYFEWMPIRDPKGGRSWEAINRSFEFGDLATLAMVETRLLARSKQAEVKGGAPGPEQFADVMAERARPDRELLGPDQQRWLEEVLAASVRANKPWQVLGNQVIMARVAGPDLTAEPYAATFGARIAKLPPVYRERLQQAAAGYKAGLPFNFDAWDGYPAARERLYAAFKRAGSRPIVLAGDSHAAWANDLYDDGRALVASEFGATAITSPSYGSLLPGLGSVLAEVNREVAFCDQDGKGYTLLTLTRTAATAQFVTVSTILAKPFHRQVVASYRARPGAARVPVEKL
ncbi:alkaline phosphatase D family protein [Sphingomonas sp. IC4-52]|uniref:alkaline phosphatase D family protein n=1 Tax=Sphingomonas sp. IC4-52 TaxID=2887202 RepID=UPI001D110443|nr:alkaline phosphatase D family protein [Sphingomonas sp. IC4-52]MCC2980825.1 alkaline phosphatase D family protein [Sphingomonas sp. IC4-52]